MSRLARTDRTLLALLLLAAIPGAARAQASVRTRAWAEGALVMGASRNVATGVGLAAQLSGSRGPHYGAVRGLIMSDFEGFPDSGGGDTIGELGLLYGRTRGGAASHVAAAVGLSMVSFDGCPDAPGSCWSFGIPVIAEAALTARAVGVGIQLFGNLNGRAPYAGLGLFLMLGWF